MRSEPTNEELQVAIGYETRDINLRPIIWSIIALLIFFTFCQGVILLFYAIAIPDWSKLGHSEPMPVNRRFPPYPQLQTDPHQDISLYRQAEEKELAGQGVAMTVEQAIDTLATQKGIAGIKGDAHRERGEGYPGQTSAIGKTAEATAPASEEKTEVPPVATPGEAGQGAH
jgi:hypothetical protein